MGWLTQLHLCMLYCRSKVGKLKSADWVPETPIFQNGCTVWKPEVRWRMYFHSLHW